MPMEALLDPGRRLIQEGLCGGILHCIVAAYQQHLRQEKGIAKKLIQTLRAIMISQDVVLVAGDFYGTAWRCRSRDNISTIYEVIF